jgi:uncharacterized protein YjbI with pentapeptide repeats
MIEPRTAPVRPRVLATASGAALPLEDEVARFVEARAAGVIEVKGPFGSGKTTALEHLAARFAAIKEIVFLDEPSLAQLASAWGGLVVCAFPSERDSFVPDKVRLAIYQLAAWTEDDLIEYLLAEHRPRCAAVMARVGPADRLFLAGVPELWRIALDRLAREDALPDARRALHCHLEEHLADTDLLERARAACLNAVLAPEEGLPKTLQSLARPGFGMELVRVLRHCAAQRMLAAERIAADLHGEADCDHLARHLPRELVRGTGLLLAGDERAAEHLHRLLAGPTWSHAMAASILHATGSGWVPQGEPPPLLAGAYLDEARWRGVRLAGADLTGADLAGAELQEAYLARVKMDGATLARARLRGANLAGVRCGGADLSHADLSEVQAPFALFDSANLEFANLGGAVLEGVILAGADLRGATFRGADLFKARFVDRDVEGQDIALLLEGMTDPAALRRYLEAVRGRATGADIEGADFTDANLTAAVLVGLCLRGAEWRGACFRAAHLQGCDLEELTLPGANFVNANLSGALLTSSVMPGADFTGARLDGAGLADVEWEGVCLRGADLRGVSFHLGSTRSGLVGSLIPCEGSRTGFYTDDYTEQTFKAPEEIRKANLCGADLRHAKLDGVDFYLVDLRGAQYHSDQEEHLRRCGAILEARV